MVVLIDAGHGSNTPGKCSPDRSLLEYKWAREVAQMLELRLKSLGFDARRIVTEDHDVSLSERCKRANAICKQAGAKNCILVSLHLNAAGADGQWHTASGWSGWVSSKNASSNSKKLAALLYDEAAKLNLKGNRAVPACKYWSGNFAIVRDTNCPAVLTENLFMDNEKEAKYLLTQEGKMAIVDLHAKGIQKYASSL